MRPDAIFAPVSVLALWTGVVLAVTAYRRIAAVRRRRISPQAFRLGESPEVPADVTVANRNLMNLLEMPILFYVVAIAFYVTHRATPGVARLAWVYAALRVLHSCEHLTANHVVRRLVLFAASNVVLVTLWIRFISRLF
jgi:hypothetical protein